MKVILIQCPGWSRDSIPLSGSILLSDIMKSHQSTIDKDEQRDNN